MQAYIDQQKAKGDWKTYLTFQSDADHNREMAQALNELKAQSGCPKSDTIPPGGLIDVGG